MIGSTNETFHQVTFISQDGTCYVVETDLEDMIRYLAATHYFLMDKYTEEESLLKEVSDAIYASIVLSYATQKTDRLIIGTLPSIIEEIIFPYNNSSAALLGKAINKKIQTEQNGYCVKNDTHHEQLASTSIAEKRFFRSRISTYIYQSESVRMIMVHKLAEEKFQVIVFPISGAAYSYIINAPDNIHNNFHSTDNFQRFIFKDLQRILGERNTFKEVRDYCAFQLAMPNISSYQKKILIHIHGKDPFIIFCFNNNLYSCVVDIKNLIHCQLQG